MSSPGNDSPANKKPASAEPVPDRSTADVGIVCTHKGELKAFLKRVDRQRSYTEKKITVRGGFWVKRFVWQSPKRAKATRLIEPPPNC